MPRTRAQFEEFIHARTEDPPEILYKYRTVEQARQILSTGKISWSSPLSFNDPFDTQWNIMWQMQTPAARRSERAMIRAALTRQASWPKNTSPIARQVFGDEMARLALLSRTERAAELNHVIDELAEISDVQGIASRRWRSIQRRMRVYCLSADKHSMLMWSHYSNEHRGVVIGFNTNILERAFRAPYEPVIYKTQLPKLIDVKSWQTHIIFDTPTPPAMVGGREFALTKEKNWKYEKEWRTISIEEEGTLGVRTLHNIPENSVVSLAFGCRCDPHEARNLVTLAQALSSNLATTVLSQHPSKLAFIEDAFD